MISNNSSYLESTPTAKEKALSTLSYLSLGILGLVLLLLGHGQTRFLKYHIYQSLFLGILFLLINYGSTTVFGLLFSLLALIPLLKSLSGQILPLLLTVLQAIELGVIVYSVITIWQNKYTWIKWVSAQIYKMI